MKKSLLAIALASAAAIANAGPLGRPECIAPAVAQRLADFERHYESIAYPFEWKFTRADLNALLARMRSRYAQTQQRKLAA